MEFEELFVAYLNEWTLEIENKKTSKIYKSILKDIKIWFYEVSKTKKNIQKSRKKMEREYLAIRIQFPSIEEAVILKDTQIVLNGFNRLMIYFDEQENNIDTYLNILEGLQNITMEYYKDVKTENKNTLLYIRVLLEIFLEAYERDITTFEKVTLQITDAIEKEQIPILDYAHHVYFLKDFLLQKISCEKNLNFARYQKETMNR